MCITRTHFYWFKKTLCVCVCYNNFRLKMCQGLLQCFGRFPSAIISDCCRCSFLKLIYTYTDCISSVLVVWCVAIAPTLTHFFLVNYVRHCCVLCGVWLCVMLWKTVFQAVCSHRLFRDLTKFQLPLVRYIFLVFMLWTKSGVCKFMLCLIKAICWVVFMFFHNFEPQPMFTDMLSYGS